MAIPNAYWAKRAASTQEKLTDKSIADTEKQLTQYYLKSMEKIIGQFEQTHNKLLSTIKEGKSPTPADLYKLDKYWQLQAQLKKELQKLGDTQHILLSKKFLEQYETIYNAMALKDDKFFTDLDRKAAQQMIQQIWCADGKSWSNRIWTNTDKLQQALNDNLLDCVLTGKKTGELRKLLMNEFDVAYNRADRVVRTEMAHIQTQAARQRYLDSGISEVEVWASEDERRCEKCGKLHMKRFPIYDVMPVPAHSNCRCCIIPVVEDRTDFSKETDSTPKNLTNNKNKDNIAVSRGRNISQEWKTAKFRDKKAEERHYKHLVEYGSISFEEYVEGARMLLSQPIGQNVDGFINNSGATYRYDIINNDFAIGKEGLIYTRFKPIDAIEYWKGIRKNELKQKR